MKRCLLFLLLPLAFASLASAQTPTPTPTPGTTTTGLAVSTDCPASAAPGSVFTCTFTIQNLDPVNDVSSLLVTNTVPSPGGTTTTVPCFQGSFAVTVLAHNGTAGGADTCQGSVDETAPGCGG